MPRPLINHAAVRRLALHAANDRRQAILPSKPFTRVAESFYCKAETEFRRVIERMATDHLQKGKTLT